MLPAHDGDKAPSPPALNLKRPPPSPSASSSPKRAASEGPLGGDSQLHSQLSSVPTALPSSPLAMDVDETESTGWIARTEQVSLSSDSASPGGAAWLNSNLSEKCRLIQGSVMASGSPPFTPGGFYYLIPKLFFQALTTFGCSGEGSQPQIDMASLAQGDPIDLWAPDRAGGGSMQPFWKVRQGLEEDTDYMFTGAEGWDAIQPELFSGGESIPVLQRVCLADGRIEVQPNIYKLHIVTTTPSLVVPPAVPPSPISFTIPRTSTVKQLREFVRGMLKDRGVTGTTPFRIFTLNAPKGPTSLEVAAKDLADFDAELLGGNDKTLENLGFADNDSLVAEIGDPKFAVDVDLITHKAVNIGGGAPAPLFGKPAFYSGNQSSSGTSGSDGLLSLTAANKSGPLTRSQLKSKGGGKGLVGLVNLGNTCFLASATQCLSNTHVLVDYFLTNVYEEELNPDNPLGMQGQVAEAFGETIKNLWESESFRSYSPRRLKGTCSRFAPQFAGYGQHDTQEFLAFLLDGLHEDLNRIKQKPYIEKPDWKAGGGDRELAELGRECWEGYKKRNDSVIVDLFQGQLQSTLVCPDCHKESITMDPFMYLTVPLPISQTREVKVLFYPRDTEKPPVAVHMLIRANASFVDLKDKLGRLTGTQGSNIVGFDLWKNGIYQWWMDIDATTSMGNNDVGVFYEVGAPVTQTGKGVGTRPTDSSVTVPVFTFTPNDSQSSYSSNPIPHDNSLEPFFITLSKTEAADPAAVREAIMRGYSRLVIPVKREELWVASNDPHAKVVDDDENVAEIRIDSSPVSPTDTLAPPSELTRNASHASLASQSGRLVTRGDLFKVWVADASSSEDNKSFSGFGPKKDPNVNTLFRGSPNKASDSWSSLEKRARTKRSWTKRVASSVSSMVGSAHNSDDESDETASGSAVVRKGEGIFVQWSSDNLKDFFELPRDDVLKRLDVLVDPEIAKDLEKKKAGRAITLDDCLDEFSKQETLGRDDEWYCPVCKKHVQATKKLDIYKAPDILVICLKRFGSARNLRDKLDHKVEYPLKGLNLDNRIEERRIAQSLKLTDEEAKHYGIEHSTEPFIYDLYAVDNHFGGLGGGHYTAYCHNKVDDQWYNYDDSRVSRADISHVKNNRAAYLLFYKRRTERRIGGISRLKAEEASRAATPLGSVMGSTPGSPNIGPSVPASAMASSMPSGPGSPNETSPIVSDDSSSTSDSEDFKGMSHPIGFLNPATMPFNTRPLRYGNSTNWGRSGTGATGVSAVHHQYGSLPTPDGSEHGDTEFIEVAVPAASSAARSDNENSQENGLGESYDVVNSQGATDSDAEMVSIPRSPQSAD